MSLIYGKRIRISCQSWAYNPHFVFWNSDSCQVLLLFFVYQSFQGSRKIGLKTQVPLVSQKKDARKFEDMKNPLCTNSSFINSLQNVQCRFLILSKFKLYLYFLTLISFHMRHTGQNLDKILSSLYIGKRVIFDPSGKLI